MKLKSDCARWHHFFLTILLVIGLPALLNRGAETPKLIPTSADRKACEPRYLEDFKRIQPSFVFIGNSMVDSRIDVTRINELTRPQKTYRLTRPGSGSSIWYLFFKHHLIRSGVRPVRLFFLFRDVDLTKPDTEAMRDWGKESWQDLVADDDPVFDRVLAQSPAKWKESLGFTALKIYPVRLRQKQAETSIEALSRTGWVETKLGEYRNHEELHQLIARRGAQTQREVNALYDLNHLRSEAPIRFEDPTYYDFDYWLPRSTLPEIISLAKQHQIPLCFIRIKRRPDADRTVTQPEALKAYVTKLETYIESNGCLFHDDTDDSEFTATWYANDDHIAVSYTRRYTDKLFKTIPEAFK